MTDRSGANRIYLAHRRALFLGHMPELPLHRHGSAAVLFGCSGPIQVRAREGDWTACHAVLIPPFAYHATRSGDQIMGVLFQEPGSEMFRSLADRQDWLLEPEEFQATLSTLRGLASVAEGEAHAGDVAEQIALQLNETLTRDEATAMDARVLEIMALIEEDPEAAPGVEALGRRAGISGSRLIHLFSEQTGTTLRRFRGWHRMKAAARELNRGADLTTAAHAAGFFDSAHFSRAFKNMFGLPPSEVFRAGTRIIFPAHPAAS